MLTMSEVNDLTTDSANPEPEAAQHAFTVRAVNDNVIAVDCPNNYTRSKPSFLVAEPNETSATAESTQAGGWSLETETLLVEAQVDPPRVRIYRKDAEGNDPVYELRDPSPEGASVIIDRGFALYGIGGNNSLKLRTTEDIDLLTDIDLDRQNFRV